EPGFFVPGRTEPTVFKLKQLPLLVLLWLLLGAVVACSSSKSTTSTATSGPAVSTVAPAATGGSARALPVTVTVTIDFTGSGSNMPNVSKTVQVPAQTNALNAVQTALGPENLKTTDFGGSLGIFINGFYNVVPSGNSYWEFSVNGKSSDVGVSSYIVKDKDVI